MTRSGHPDKPKLVQYTAVKTPGGYLDAVDWRTFAIRAALVLALIVGTLLLLAL